MQLKQTVFGLILLSGAWPLLGQAAQIGNASATPVATLELSTIVGTVFTADQSFTATDVHVNTTLLAPTGTMGVQVAVYDVDGSGIPTHLLADSLGIPIGPGNNWNTFPLTTPIAIVAGKRYFLCANIGGSGTASTAAVGQGSGGDMGFSFFMTYAIGSWPSTFMADGPSIPRAIFLSGLDYTPSNTPTSTRTFTPTVTRTGTPTRTFTATPTRTHSATATRTATGTPTFTPTPTRTHSATYTTTPTMTATGTRTPTFTRTPSFTVTPTRTHSATATGTTTPTPTFTITVTRTHSPTFTATGTRTHTPTWTATRTGTPTLTITPTFTITPTATETRTATQTSTVTPTPTITPTLTQSATYTCTPTITETSTVSPTFTITPTITPTLTASPTLVAMKISEGDVVVYPNPVKAKTLWFYYRCSGPSRVTIDVVNVLGERVHTVGDEPNTAGIVRTAWDISTLAPGIYLYRVRIAGTEGTTTIGWKKFVVVR